jgi:predicted lipid-binding transport protein (Tim44 family)
MSIDPIMIVFAAVAIFVGWRLWSVLGTRTGAERPPMQGPGAARFGGNIVDVTPNPPPPVASADRWRGVAEPGSALARGLDAVAAGDPSFDAQHFLVGARAAYEMIINAFAAGDGEALGRLLGPEPLANFTRAIEARKAAGQNMVVTLVSIDSAEIVDAGVQNGAAQVAVKFAAKMNSATTDPGGRVVEGSATDVADHVDVWTFGRALASRDPNWLLAATEATH